MIDATAQSSWRSATRPLGMLSVACLGLLAACAAIPAQEMSNARQAIDAATRGGGDQKAAMQMQEARSALSHAEMALKNRQYKLARQLAQKARGKAIEAQHLEAMPAASP